MCSKALCLHVRHWLNNGLIIWQKINERKIFDNDCKRLSSSKEVPVTAITKFCRQINYFFVCNCDGQRLVSDFWSSCSNMVIAYSFDFCIWLHSESFANCLIVPSRICLFLELALSSDGETARYDHTSCDR